MRIADPKGFLLGLVFAVFALVVLGVSQTYTMGSATDMGPGYFPRLVGLTLLAVAASVIVQSLLRPGPAVDFRPLARPALFLTVAIIAFAWLMQPLGLGLSLMILMGLSAHGSRETRWREVFLSSVAVALGSYLVFVVGLGLPMPLLPWFMR